MARSSGKAFGKGGSRWSVDKKADRQVHWNLLDYRLFTGTVEPQSGAVQHRRDTPRRAILRDKYGNLAVCRLYAERADEE